MRKLFAYWGAIASLLILAVLLGSHPFSLVGALAVGMGFGVVKISQQFSPISMVVLAACCSLVNFLVYAAVFIYGFREGEVAVFGPWGDDHRFMEYFLNGRADAARASIEFTSQDHYLNFLNFLFSIGGFPFIFAVSWWVFLSSATTLCWSMFKQTDDRCYLSALIFLVFFPDVYFWASTLYKEIWVASFVMLIISQRGRFGAFIIGFLALAYIRFVFAFPALAAALIPLDSRRVRSKFRFWQIFYLILILSALGFVYSGQFGAYFSVFFGELRLEYLFNKLAWPSSSYLGPNILVLFATSPLISLATPLPIYFKEVVIHDALWFMTSASGAYMAFLMPWILSYRRKDALLASFVFLSILIVLAWLFLTNRHRFTVSILAVIMGGFALTKRPEQFRLGFVFTIAVFVLQFVLLKTRVQIG